MTDASTDAKVPDERRLLRHPLDRWVPAEPRPMLPWTRGALDGVIRAVCPESPAPQLAGGVESLATPIRVQIRYMGWPARWAMVAALLLLDTSPWWRLKSWRRLRSMDRTRASALLAKIGHSRFGILRQLVLGARALVLPSYFDQDEVHEALGYAPRAFMLERIKLRRKMRTEKRAPAPMQLAEVG